MRGNFTVLISGSRKYRKIFPIRDVLFESLEDVPDDKELVIVHGGAQGVDWTASFWANLYDIQERVYKANWKEHGKAAGPIRNSQMLNEENIDLVLAFPCEDSIGTWDMIKKAKAKNIKTIVTKVSNKQTTHFEDKLLEEKRNES